MSDEKTTPTADATAAKDHTPNGNIGVGSAGDDMGGQAPLPPTPQVGQESADATAEPGLVGREESGVQGEMKSGFTGDEPHLPGQAAEPGNPDAATHYLPEGEHEKG